MEYAIKTSQLTKSYNGIPIVDGVNLTVPKGSIYGLIGRNGAGKSTLIKMLSGLTIPTSGKLSLLDSTDKKSLRQAKIKTGFFIETPSFFGDLNAAENLEYYRILKGYPRKSIIADMIELVGLTEHSNKPYRLFSFGMRQKLALALALMGDPELVILDEPTNGLDPQGLSLFKDIIVKINREKGTTFMIASHMLTDLSEVANYYGFMVDGKLLEQTSKTAISEFCRTCTVLSVNSTSLTSVIIAEACPDHIHMLLEIPPKIAVSSFMGYLKGKSSTMLYEQFDSRPAHRVPSEHFHDGMSYPASHRNREC